MTAASGGGPPDGVRAGVGDGFGHGTAGWGRRGGNRGPFGINDGTRGGGEADGQFGGEGRPRPRPVPYGGRTGQGDCMAG